MKKYGGKKYYETERIYECIIYRTESIFEQSNVFAEIFSQTSSGSWFEICLEKNVELETREILLKRKNRIFFEISLLELLLDRFVVSSLELFKGMKRNEGKKHNPIHIAYEFMKIFNEIKWKGSRIIFTKKSNQSNSERKKKLHSKH